MYFLAFSGGSKGEESGIISKYHIDDSHSQGNYTIFQNPINDSTGTLSEIDTTQRESTPHQSILLNSLKESFNIPDKGKNNTINKTNDEVKNTKTSWHNISPMKKKDKREVISLEESKFQGNIEIQKIEIPLHIDKKFEEKKEKMVRGRSPKILKSIVDVVGSGNDHNEEEKTSILEERIGCRYVTSNGLENSDFHGKKRMENMEKNISYFYSGETNTANGGNICHSSKNDAYNEENNKNILCGKDDVEHSDNNNVILIPEEPRITPFKIDYYPPDMKKQIQKILYDSNNKLLLEKHDHLIIIYTDELDNKKKTLVYKKAGDIFNIWYKDLPFKNCKKCSGNDIFQLSNPEWYTNSQFLDTTTIFLQGIMVPFLQLEMPEREELFEKGVLKHPSELISHVKNHGSYERGEEPETILLNTKNKIDTTIMFPHQEFLFFLEDMFSFKKEVIQLGWDNYYKILSKNSWQHTGSYKAIMILIIFQAYKRLISLDNCIPQIWEDFSEKRVIENLSNDNEICYLHHKEKNTQYVIISERMSLDPLINGIFNDLLGNIFLRYDEIVKIIQCSICFPSAIQLVKKFLQQTHFCRKESLKNGKHGKFSMTSSFKTVSSISSNFSSNSNKQQLENFFIKIQEECNEENPDCIIRSIILEYIYEHIKMGFSPLKNSGPKIILLRSYLSKWRSAFIKFLIAQCMSASITEKKKEQYCIILTKEDNKIRGVIHYLSRKNNYFLFSCSLESFKKRVICNHQYSEGNNE